MAFGAFSLREQRYKRRLEPCFFRDNEKNAVCRPVFSGRTIKMPFGAFPPAGEAKKCGDRRCPGDGTQFYRDLSAEDGMLRKSGSLPA